jgi:hypothetical protein
MSLKLKDRKHYIQGEKKKEGKVLQPITNSPKLLNDGTSKETNKTT